MEELANATIDRGKDAAVKFFKGPSWCAIVHQTKCAVWMRKQIQQKMGLGQSDADHAQKDHNCCPQHKLVATLALLPVKHCAQLIQKTNCSKEGIHHTNWDSLYHAHKKPQTSYMISKGNKQLVLPVLLPAWLADQ